MAEKYGAALRCAYGAKVGKRMKKRSQWLTVAWSTIKLNRHWATPWDLDLSYIGQMPLGASR